MTRSNVHPRLVLAVATAMLLTLACDQSAISATATPAPPLSTDTESPTAQTTDAIPPLSDTPAPSDTPTQMPLPTDTLPPTATNTPAHLATLAEPGSPVSQIDDIDSSATAAQKRAPGGEDFANNRFERPFLADGMTYLPDVDLKHVKLSIVDTWVFATFFLSGTRAEGVGQTMYGLEIDANQDGHGDYLISGISPSGANWTTAGVQVWKDSNRDVGGATPQVSDTSGGDGYDKNLFDGGQGSDPDLAWVRRGVDPLQVQIAFKYSLLLATPKFYWNGFADAGVKRHDWFDLNDHFTLTDAGSPLAELKANYPLKNFFGYDNTCVNWYGPAPKETKAWYCQQALAAISGNVYQDKNKNGKKDSDELNLTGIQVVLYQGTCKDPAKSTDLTLANGTYFFSQLASNIYCVTLGSGSKGHLITTPNPVTVFVAPGEVKRVNFGMW
jgi:hypothetical protein